MGFVLKLFTGNPVTMIYAALAIFAVGLGLGTTGGWTLNGWRLGTELEQTKKERELAIAQGKVLAASVTSCNAGVDKAVQAAGLAIDSTRKMLEEARRLHSGGTAMVAKIEELAARKPPTRADGKPAGCDEAWDELETLRAPR